MLLAPDPTCCSATREEVQAKRGEKEQKVQQVVSKLNKENAWRERSSERRRDSTQIFKKNKLAT